MKRELLGRYPPGHPYRLEGPMRFYSLACTLLVGGLLLWAAVSWFL